MKKVWNSAITASLECWIFYFLKTTTNGETSDDRSRFQISIQLIFVKCFWDGWLSTRIGPRLSIKNNELFPLQNTIQNTIIIIVFSFVQDFFDLPSPIFWDTSNSASTLTFNLSLTWISISQLQDSRFQIWMFETTTERYNPYRFSKEQLKPIKPIQKRTY